MKRRDFLKTGAALAVGGLTVATKPVSGAAAHLPENFSLPTVRLGTLTVSRLILGSNPFWGYSHKSPQLDEEMRHHHTDERIMQILDEAADCGLTALASPPDERWVNIWAHYLENGGRLKIWISQCHGNPEQMPEEIDRSIKAGAKAIFIQGLRVEEQFGQGNFDVLRSWIEQIKEAGLPAGAAAHWPEVHPELERRNFPTDFYYQCLYNVSKTNDYSAAEREKAVATIKELEKPVIAYKILAAGRLPASEGFEYAFNHIARKDGVCVGIYAQKAIDQIRQNATYTETLTLD
ncbi:MAG: twin-arginine translocation signal domain-containing protein [Candidatus Aminicenantes bacterium]|nr:twin-arginine translocation signal domain-containing protein [Candidatus Aminicenantes bacterium]